jgi:hypothetical protein
MTIWSDLIFNPFWTGVKGIGDIWTIGFGSREQKAKTVLEYYPYTGDTTETKQAKTTILKTIETQKQASSVNKAYWGQNVFLNTDVTVPAMPDFGAIGKWLLYGGIAIIAIWGYSKLKGGNHNAE